MRVCVRAVCVRSVCVLGLCVLGLSGAVCIRCVYYVCVC